MKAHTEDRVREARKAVDLGWSLTPLRGKIPVLDSWQKQPPPTVDQVETWARAGNLGLRTGAASMLYVIDIDIDKGGDPHAFDWPATATVETGGGGLHLYFKNPPGLILKNTAGKLGAHIDTRGEGGQVVFVGSIHPLTGRVYAWQPDATPEEVGVADLPEFLIELLNPTRQNVATQIPGSAYAVAALHGCVREIQLAPEGTRNHTLNKVSFSMGQLIGGRAIHEHDVRSALEGAACAANLELAEIEATMNSGIESGKQQPRRPRGRPPRLDSPDVDADTDEKRPETLTPGAHHDHDGEYFEVGNNDFVNATLSSIPAGTLYRRAGRVGELHGEPGAQEFSGMSDGRLRAIVDEHIRLYRWRTTQQKNAEPEQLYVNCTFDLSSMLRAGALTHDSVRQLDLLTQYPVCAGEDKLEIVTAGWNATPRTYYDQPESLCGIDPDLSMLSQRGILEDLIVDFPFADLASMENFIGLMLTPILKPALDGNVPMHLITSPLERTGKTKLAEEVFGGIILGKPTPAIQLTGSDEERDKRILSLLLRGDTLVHFDNVRQFIDSASLSSLLTSQTYSGRPMARSEIVSPPNNLTVVASGNNVRMTGELAKRTIPIILQPATDRPEDRTDYAHADLRRYVRTVRRQVIAALLGLIDNWRTAGSPLHTRPLGGFERWSGIVGGILAHAGFDHWRGNDAAWRRKADAGGEDLRSFAETWHAEHGTEQMTVKELFEIAESNELFGYLIRGKTEHGRLQSFARRVLAANEDTPISTWRIKAIGYGSTRLWYLEDL